MEALAAYQPKNQLRVVPNNLCYDAAAFPEKSCWVKLADVWLQFALFKNTDCPIRGSDKAGFFSRSLDFNRLFNENGSNDNLNRSILPLRSFWSLYVFEKMICSSQNLLGCWTFSIVQWFLDWEPVPRAAVDPASTLQFYVSSGGVFVWLRARSARLTLMSNNMMIGICKCQMME